MTSCIPINSLQRHIEPFKSHLAKCAAEVIASGNYVMGPNVRAFEEAFADYNGVSHAVGVANGTEALELALRALGASDESLVAVVANAAMYGTTAVLACGATPVFIDVDPSTYTMDPIGLERALKEGQNIGFVIVTHLYGQLAKMPELMRICRQHGVKIIEDCAQAHGAVLNGKRAGSFGDVAAFSFYPTKNLGALGDGGMIITNSLPISEKIRQLRQYGWTEKYTNSVEGGRNSRLDEIQARMLLEMLPYLDEWNDRRRAVANRYSAEISNPLIQTPQRFGADYVGHLYVIRTAAREQLRAHLANAGIQTDVHYPVPDYRQPCLHGRFAQFRLATTETLANSILTLPCFPELRDDEIDRVIQACNRF